MSNNPPPPPPPPGFGDQPPHPGNPGYVPPGYGPPGYGPPPYGAQGYGAPGYGYPTNQREHRSGTTVLVLGILGLVICQVLSPIAWVMGHRARKEMAAEPGVVWSNKGNVTAGWICGIIGTALLALFVGFLLLVFVAAVSTA